MSDREEGWLRRLLVRGDNPFTSSFEQNRLRPPGAVDEARFMSLCIRCNRCLEVCPYHSIVRAGLGATVGTPYVMAERKACYLCMACSRLCPTEALNTSLRDPEKVRMGRALIDPSICYSHLFLKHDVLPDKTGQKIGALCNTCYNVCPLPDKAITLKDNLFPVVLDGCVGCGVCVERCPTRPKRAINVTPRGMGRTDEAGFYFRKARQRFDAVTSNEPAGRKGALSGRDLLDAKQGIDASGPAPKFDFPYEVEKELKDWE